MRHVAALSFCKVPESFLKTQVAGVELREVDNLDSASVEFCGTR